MCIVSVALLGEPLKLMSTFFKMYLHIRVMKNCDFCEHVSDACSVVTFKVAFRQDSVLQGKLRFFHSFELRVIVSALAVWGRS